MGSSAERVKTEMDQELLKKVQPQLLEILLEIQRVCRENDIHFFLACGSFLGAVRHQGFIPWDDDLDIGMLRQDYEKFRRIAPEALGENYCFQDWHTDPDYNMPFGKVRRRHSLYLEAKPKQVRENGFFVDVFPFDNAPVDPADRKRYAGKLTTLFRLKMMKSGATPWMNNDKIMWKKRIGYLIYQAGALFVSNDKIVEKYDALASSVPESPILCRQRGLTNLNLYERSWIEDLTDYPFEGHSIPGPRDYDAVLTAQFGDYRTLPPEGERENRHQIVKVVFPEI